MPDPHQIHPGNGKPTKAEGIFFLGNELSTGKEIWLTNDDCRQHFLILGTTGAGKALPDDAPIHTIRGWRTMADIRVGDRISMPDGTSAWVDGDFPQGELDIYRVTLDRKSTRLNSRH